MGVISMLSGDANRMYDRQLFTDLQMDKILSDRAIRILRIPCPEAMIELRQSLFVSMDDPQFAEKLNDFRNALLNLSSFVTRWGEARADLEKNCIYLHAIAAYVEVCRRLEQLGKTNRLMKHLWDALNSAEHQALLQTVQADLAEAFAQVKAMERSVFYMADSAEFADRAWLLKDTTIESYEVRLANLAKRLNIELEQSREQSLHLDEALDEAYAELYSEEIRYINGICEQYPMSILREPLIWPDELSFFAEIHQLCQTAREKEIAVCIPAIASTPCYRAKNAYDITLTAKNPDVIVPNDIDFSEKSSFYFLTGANGGGKTTYLRTVGVNLLLGLAGCPMFAETAIIYPFSGVFSHFPEAEDFNGMGRLDSETLRIQRILERAEKASFLLLNEAFSATDEEKGLQLAVETAETLRDRGIFGLFVTHFLEVKTKGFPLLSAVVEDDEAHRRTYRILQTSGASSSYAEDILRKYKLDAASLATRGR